MNDIITNGAEIKQRIISEINNARQCVNLAMAWFTDRDIANAFIEAKNRNVTVDIILSSNAQNDTVKQMLCEANISVHSFETGDTRGMMHHKFCLIDNKISISGSYNYSYNAGTNNVENIHISDDYSTYKQLLAEFERLKSNIDINSITQHTTNMQATQQINTVDSFTQQLSNLIYSSAQINTDDYKKQGFEKSKESGGNIDIFKAEYAHIKEQICAYATDDGLSSKKNILTSIINAAFESKKSDLEIDKSNELTTANNSNDLEKKYLEDKMSELKNEKSILESGNTATGEIGLLQINKEIDKNKLEKRAIYQSLVVKKFWKVGTVLALLGLCVFSFYLSIFFASAMYKVFFEGNIIRAAKEAGLPLGIPQLVDANAIIKIFNQQGLLFSIMAMLFFLIPILLSNLKLLGSTIKWVNTVCFVVGLVIFDVLVSIMVAMNTDDIKCLLIGQTSEMQIWDVWKHGEFWLIFVFGMLPLIITHYIIDYIVESYKKSQRELVDEEKDKQIKLLDEEMIELTADRDFIVNKVKEKDEEVKANNDKIQKLETDFNVKQSQIESKYTELLKRIKSIYDDFYAKITSGRIFTDEILSNVISAYQSGFIEYLPNYYSENEVANRVRKIEEAVKNNQRFQ